jgi:hypothetical protein
LSVYQKPFELTSLLISTNILESLWIFENNLESTSK